MARLPRLFVEAVAQHVIQRGIIEKLVFIAMLIMHFICRN